jgi:hypothetical protein
MRKSEISTKRVIFTRFRSGRIFSGIAFWHWLTTRREKTGCCSHSDSRPKKKMTTTELFETTVETIRASGRKPTLDAILDVVLYAEQPGMIEVPKSKFLIWFSTN